MHIDCAWVKFIRYIPLPLVFLEVNEFKKYPTFLDIDDSDISHTILHISLANLRCILAILISRQ